MNKFKPFIPFLSVLCCSFASFSADVDEPSTLFSILKKSNQHCPPIGASKIKLNPLQPELGFHDLLEEKGEQGSPKLADEQSQMDYLSCSFRGKLKLVSKELSNLSKLTDRSEGLKSQNFMLIEEDFLVDLFEGRQPLPTYDSSALIFVCPELILSNRALKVSTHLRTSHRISFSPHNVVILGYHPFKLNRVVIMLKDSRDPWFLRTGQIILNRLHPQCSYILLD